ncbi:MAG TPA: 2-C-methyl-D-erythritol 4-phosphate cytidylyltransferase [Thermomicrobiales bacterium]
METPDLVAAAVIVAAGRGTRFGKAPKLFARLDDRPVLTYALEAAQQATQVSSIVLVVNEQQRDHVVALTRSLDLPKLHAIVLGGERRQDSVEAGIAAVPAETTVVAIHDAARPLVSPWLFDRCISEAATSGAAIAAIPVVDTLKLVEDGTIVRTVPREGLWAAQTPQSFALDRLREAFAHANAQGIEVTDEASLFEALGWPVTVVQGSRDNLKITMPEDLPIAEAIIRSRRGTPGAWP